VDLNNLTAAGRILWGAAFSLAILKTIKVSFFFSRLPFESRSSEEVVRELWEESS